MGRIHDTPIPPPSGDYRHHATTDRPPERPRPHTPSEVPWWVWLLLLFALFQIFSDGKGGWPRTEPDPSKWSIKGP